jgi:uncharacterized paraquat-inducible protein A
MRIFREGRRMTDDLISRAEAIEEIEFGITNMKAINMETGEVIEPFAKINAELREAVNRVKELPSAQPEPEEFEWCNGCKEYDQEKHCCHRWTKVIRKTVDEIKADPVRHGHWIKEFENEDGRNLRCSECRMVFYVGKGRDGNYCPNCGARMDEERREE